MGNEEAFNAKPGSACTNHLSHQHPLQKKSRRNKKDIRECLKRSLPSLHEIQNRTANKFLFTQSSELFSFVCSIWHISVFKFTTVVYWTVSEWCEYIAVSEEDGAIFKNICC